MSTEKIDISDDSYCSIAQLVELVTVNHPVPGSSPGGTVKTDNIFRSMVERAVGKPLVAGSSPAYVH